MGSSMKKTVFTEGVVESLRKWKRRAKKRVAGKRKSRHGCDCNCNLSPPRASVDAGIDSPPSFRLEAAPSLDCGGLYNLQDHGGDHEEDHNSNKFKGKRPLGSGSESDQPV